MKSKLTFGLVSILVTSLLLLAANAIAQTTLDPTQSNAYPAYPAYIDHSCGGVTVIQYSEIGNTARYKFTTKCSTGGRGSVPTIYLACWEVSYATDRYYILSRDELVSAHWKQGQAQQVCP